MTVKNDFNSTERKCEITPGEGILIGISAGGTVTVETDVETRELVTPQAAWVCVRLDLRDHEKAGR